MVSTRWRRIAYIGARRCGSLQGKSNLKSPNEHTAAHQASAVTCAVHLSLRTSHSLVHDEICSNRGRTCTISQRTLTAGTLKPARDVLSQQTCSGQTCSRHTLPRPPTWHDRNASLTQTPCRPLCHLDPSRLRVAFTLKPLGKDQMRPHQWERPTTQQIHQTR